MVYHEQVLLSDWYLISGMVHQAHVLRQTPLIKRFESIDSTFIMYHSCMIQWMVHHLQVLTEIAGAADCKMLYLRHKACRKLSPGVLCYRCVTSTDISDWCQCLQKPLKIKALASPIYIWCRQKDINHKIQWKQMLKGMNQNADRRMFDKNDIPGTDWGK